MKALVVYDSVFGNTEKVALAMGEALEELGEARALRVGEVTQQDMEGLNVLLVGSPTRAFSPTPTSKRFLRGLPSRSLDGVTVAAFDTRVDVAQVGNAFLTTMVKLFGYAADPLLKLLRRKGGEAAPKGTAWFFVQDTEGPLREDELERAAAWALDVAAGA